MEKNVLIIGSAPDAILAKEWSNPPFDHIIAINNAWRVRADWSNCIFPEDFPSQKRPIIKENQKLNSAEDYVPAQNYFGGFVYAGGTMAFTAAYWALDVFKPKNIVFLGLGPFARNPDQHKSKKHETREVRISLARHVVC